MEDRIHRGEVTLRHRAAPAGSHVPHLVQQKGAVVAIKPGELGHEFTDERIAHDGCNLLLPLAAGIAEKMADVDLKSRGEALKRRQSRHGFAVFNLGDVGARHLHAASELALAEAALTAQIANGARDLEAAILFDGLACICDEMGQQLLGFLDFKGFVAAPAA